MNPDREDELKRGVRAYFTGKGYASTSARDLAETLSVTEREFPAFTELLYEFEEAGIAVHLEGRGWFAPRREGWLAGILVVNRRGFGFVRPADEDPKGDVFIPANKLKDGHHGDLVLVKLRAKPRGGGGRPKARGGDGSPGREGSILYVLRRSRRIILGQFWSDARGGGVVEPLRHESVREIHIAAGLEKDAENGDRVLVRLRDGASIGGLPPGEVTEVALPEGTWKADLQIVCAEFGLPQEFPAEVEEAAAALPGMISDAEIARRTDLRDVPFFTIDPSDAKDHDDAIALEDHGDDGFLLGVGIADVSAFVRANDVIDKEAYNRATSVYLPGLTLPMLPERLSNDLCSLKPEVDRLAKVVWISFDRDGKVLSARAENAVIRSHRKFSYSEAQELLDGAPPDPDEAPYVPTLLALDRLRAALHARRLARGSLDLDLPEMRLRLDDEGEVVDLEPKVRDRSHHIVEECMLAANEAVARIATERSIAIIRRSHDEPPEEDVTKFLKLCRLIVPGVRINGTEDFPKLVEKLGKDPAAPIVQLALLRTLTRAEYTPEKSLHFALATDEYCHFTSPIRRFPDLQVHRALDDALFGSRRVLSAETEAKLASLGAQASHASERERTAENAEREMSKMRAISFLRLRIGERFTGVIAAVREHGFFVRLDEFLLEGMVHISNLRDDFYVFNETHFALRGRNTGKSFGLGDAVEVKLHDADPLHRTIDLRYLHHLAPEGETQGKGSGRSSSRGRSDRRASKKGRNRKR